MNHVGIWVDDIKSTVAKLRQKGVRIELLEYPTESWQKQAMDSWR